MSLDSICGKSGQSSVVLCMPVQHQIFPPLAEIIAARCRGMLATRCCRHFYRDFCPFIQQGLVEITMILGRFVYTGDCMAQFIPNMLCGVAVWRSCRLLHLCDAVLLKGVKDYLSTVKCGNIILVAVVIPKMLPGKWH